MNMTREAAWLREALRFGVVAPSDVARWAGEHLEEGCEHYDRLLDLSFIGSKDPFGALSILGDISNEIPAIEVMPEILGFTCEKVRADARYCRELAKTLFQIYLDADFKVSPELESIGWFDDAFSLADSGVHGSARDVQVEFESFLEGFRGREYCRFKPANYP